MPVQTSSRVAALKNVATRLRIDSVRATTEAGSGHPTSCASAAEIVASLFFSEMRYDPRYPQNPDNDRFVLSKGHAAPILYSAWAEVGLLTREITGVGPLMWASDYPHPEGTFPESQQVVERIFAGVPEAELTAIVSGNAAALYRVAVPA